MKREAELKKYPRKKKESIITGDLEPKVRLS